MGQKANPISLRLQINRDFDTAWYSEKSRGSYSKVLARELQIRTYLQSLMNHLDLSSSRVIFQFYPKKLVIHSFLMDVQRKMKFNSYELSSKGASLSTHYGQKKLGTRGSSLLKDSPRKPNDKSFILLLKYILFVNSNTQNSQDESSHLFFLLFQRLLMKGHEGGTLVGKPSYELSSKGPWNSNSSPKEAQTVDLRSNSRTEFSKRYQLPLSLTPRGLRPTTSDQILQIYPLKLQNKYVSAHFVAEFIARSFESNMSFREIFRTIQKEILGKSSGIRGLRIMCSGRLGGAEMAKVESRKFGQTSLQTFSQQVDFAQAEAYTLYGIIGVKVWLVGE